MDESLYLKKFRKTNSSTVSILEGSGVPNGPTDACLESDPRRVSVIIYFIERNNGQDIERERKASEVCEKHQKDAGSSWGKSNLIKLFIVLLSDHLPCRGLFSPPSVLSSDLLLQREA